MIKLARNALGFLKSFFDGDGNQINWDLIKQLQKLQQHEGLNLGNKLSSNIHIHKTTIAMVTQMFSAQSNPFKYLLTYRFS